MSSSSKVDIMKKVDIYLLDQLEILKQKPELRKIIDQHNSLDDKHKVYIRYVFMLLSVGLPLVVCLVVYGLYASQASKLATHEQIIEKAKYVISKTSQIKSQSQQVIGNEISTESLLKTKISGLLNSAGIDQSKISVSNFNFNELAGISEVEATMQFKEISDRQFYGILNKILIQGKFKATAIDILKNDKNQLLEGSIDLAYYGKLEKNEE